MSGGGSRPAARKDSSGPQDYVNDPVIFVVLFSSKIDRGHGALGSVRNLEELRRLEAEHASEDVGGEHLLRRVEIGRDVVVELAREADLVLGARQLFLQHL